MKIFLNSVVSVPTLCLKIAAGFGICFCPSLSCPATEIMRHTALWKGKVNIGLL